MPALGSRVVETHSLPVGFGLSGLAVTLADGRHLAVKARERGTHARTGLEIEAFMLGELGRLSELPLPRVHYADSDLLVMDFIANDGGGITPGVERHASRLIASLHATPRERFGYDRDTLIGPLLQPNPQAPRRKSKPKFEVPTDAGEPSAAGWVYRDDGGTAEPAEPPVPTAKSIVAAPSSARATYTEQRLLTNAVVLFATGFGLMTRIAMTALSFVATPVNVIRRRPR